MTNCKNCGAPITSRVCEYCGTGTGICASSVEVCLDDDYIEFFGWEGKVVRRIPTGGNVTVNINDPILRMW